MRHLFSYPLGAAPYSRGTPCNVPLDPFVGASIIGGGANLIGGAINNIVNRSNMQKQIDASKELMNYQWRNFQSYEAQSNSMKKAGLNPAAMFGQSGASSASPSVNIPTLAPSSIGSDLAGSIDAIAKAKSSGEEALGKALENDVFMKTFSDQVKKVGLQNRWTETEIQKMDQEVSKIVADVHQIEKNVQLSDKQIKWFDRIQSANIQDLKSSAAYHDALRDMTESQKKLLDETMEDLKSYAHYNAEQIQKLVGLLDKYGDAQAIVGMVSQVVSSASDLIGNFVPSKTIKHVVENVTHSAK